MMNKKMVGINGDIPWTTDQYRVFAEYQVEGLVKFGLIQESERAEEMRLLMEAWERKPYIEVITNYKRDHKK